MSRREDFIRARGEGRRRAGRRLVLWARFREELPPRPSRLGLVVGRRHGLAVQRVLFKRRVREAFRLNKGSIPRGWDLILMPRTSDRKETFPSSFQELEGDFMRLVREAVEK